MREHPGNRYEDLPKPTCGLRGPLHSWDGGLSVIHFVVNNVEELRRTIDGVGAPSMVKAPTSILVVNMLGPVAHKRGPLITSLRISSNAILKEVTLHLEKLLLEAFTSTCLNSLFFITLTVDCETGLTLHLALCCKTSCWED